MATRREKETPKQGTEPKCETNVGVTRSKGKGAGPRALETDGSGERGKGPKHGTGCRGPKCGFCSTCGDKQG